MTENNPSQKLLKIIVSCPRDLYTLIYQVYQDKIKGLASKAGIKLKVEYCRAEDFVQKLDKPGWTIAFYISANTVIPASARRAGFRTDDSQKVENERKVAFHDIARRPLFEYRFKNGWESLKDVRLEHNSSLVSEAGDVADHTPVFQDLEEDFNYFLRFFPSRQVFKSKVCHDLEQLVNVFMQPYMDLPPYLATGKAVKKEKEPAPVSPEKDMWVSGNQVSILTLQVETTPMSTETTFHGHSGLLELERSFYKHSLDIIEQNQGQEIASDGRSLSYFFSGNDFRKKTLLAAIQILKAADMLNVSSKVHQKVSVKIAGHEGACSQETLGTELEELVVFTNSLLTIEGQPGKLIVSDLLLKSINKDLRLCFRYSRRFFTHPIYIFDKDHGSQPSQELLKFCLKQSMQKGRQILEILNGNYYQDPTGMGQMKQLFFELFDIINEVCHQWFVEVDRQKGKAYLRLVSNMVAMLVKMEAKVWQALKTTIPMVQGDTINTEFRAFVRHIGSYRVDPTVTLSELQGQLVSELGGMNENAPKGVSFDDKLTFALEADELEIELALTDLQRNCMDELIEFLQNANDDPRAARLIELIWCHNELFPRSNLLRVLIKKGDPRFKAAAVLSGLPNISGESTIHEALNSQGLVADAKAVDLMMRYLATRHRNKDVRVWAAFRLHLSSLWKLTYQAGTQLSTLYNVCVSLRRHGCQDYEKIFFDCTYSRILQRLKKVKSTKEIRALCKVISLFNEMEFLVQDAYFARYDALLRSFQETLARMEIRDKMLQDMRNILIDDQKSAEDTTTRVPANLEAMPLPLQRQLAGQSHYFGRFTGARDKRIAMETMRHVTVNNVAKVLTKHDVNEYLFRTLLTESRFFSRPQNVRLALLNVKCTPAWAQKQLARWFGNDLGRKHIRNFPVPKVQNPEIRAIIIRWMNKLK